MDIRKDSVWLETSRRIIRDSARADTQYLTPVGSLPAAIDTLQLITDAIRGNLKQLSANTHLAAAIRTVEN